MNYFQVFVTDYGEWTALGLLLALLVIPPLFHLGTGWPLRRSQIVGQLSERGIRLYFQQFHPSIELGRESLSRTFERHYGRSYGRRHYVYPLVLLTLVGAFLLYLVLNMAFTLLLNVQATNNLPALASAAVAGAYLWVVLDLIRRCHSRELAPYDINVATVRMAVAIPLGYAFTATFGTGAAWLAFLLGAFPLQTLTVWARKLVSSKLSLDDEGAQRSELESLDNVTRAMAERLNNVGITTVSQLACTDPIDLSIRANLELYYVTDCISQALAWIYFKDNISKAKKYFLRGAQEINSLIADLESDDVSTKKAAIETVDLLATDMEVKTAVLTRALKEEVAEDPFTEFICDLWGINEPTADAGASALRTNRQQVPADDRTEAIVTVELRSTDNRAITGDTVELRTDTQTATINPLSGTSNARGIVTFRVRSSAPGEVSVSAVDTTENVEIAPLTITFTPT